MTGRRQVILAHWSIVFLLAALLIEGPAATLWLIWLCSGTALAWFATLLLGCGSMAQRGPKPDRLLRRIHRAQHHAPYIALAVLTFFVLTDLQADATGRALKVLVFFGLLHGALHLWRHSALFHGALRTIPPRALHGLL